MKLLPSLYALMGTIALGLLFVFPIWRIILIAPQYPDGVEMHIYIDKIGGTSPGTLQNINILNHYVGMDKIEPDAIPELKYFPFIIGFMMALGVATLILNQQRIYLSWALLLIILGLLGMYDFYLWEYNYGHNLSDTAPIKIPGANFQPPLIGTKLILNFVAKSLPHVGGVAYALAILLGGLAWWTRKKQTI